MLVQELFESFEVPSWFFAGQKLSYKDLNHLDAAEFIEPSEFRYEWRLCLIPTSALPIYSEEDIKRIVDMGISNVGWGEEHANRMNDIRAWLKDGIDGQKDHPVVVIYKRGKLNLADGWHRATAAHELGWPQIWAVVGIRKPKLSESFEYPASEDPERQEKLRTILRILDKNPKFQPFRDRIRIFGGVARGNLNAGDIDIWLDFSEVRDFYKVMGDVNIFLSLAKK